MPPNNKTRKHKTCPPEICPTGECPEKTKWHTHKQRCVYQSCPPEICPTGECPQYTTWNVAKEECIVKPYNEWGVKKEIEKGIRRIPEDLKLLVGEEVYKREYEDKAVELGEKIEPYQARNPAKHAAIVKPPPQPPAPEQIEDKGPIVVRKLGVSHKHIILAYN